MGGGHSFFFTVETTKVAKSTQNDQKVFQSTQKYRKILKISHKYPKMPKRLKNYSKLYKIKGRPQVFSKGGGQQK